MSVIAEDILTHWRIVQPLFSIPDEDAEYDRAIVTLNALIDEVGSDEQHPLYELLDTLGAVIHAYDDREGTHCLCLIRYQRINNETQLFPTQ